MLVTQAPTTESLFEEVLLKMFEISSFQPNSVDAGQHDFEHVPLVRLLPACLRQVFSDANVLF